MEIRLQSYFIEDLAFQNDMIEQHIEKIQIPPPNIRYSVQHSSTQGRALCRMEVEVGNMDSASPLYMRVKLRGTFQCGGDSDHVQVHRETFRQLYPYARAALSQVMTLSGIPPFFLPYIDPNGMKVAQNDPPTP